MDTSEIGLDAKSALAFKRAADIVGDALDPTALSKYAQALS